MPESQVHDETRLFDEARRNDLSARLVEVRQKLGVRVFLVALTYAGDARARDTAARLAASWSQGGAALVILHDRGKAQSAIGVSRGFWDRYPADEVVTLTNTAADILQRRETTAEQNVSDATLTLVPRLSRMESERGKRTQDFTRQEARLAAAMGCTLLVLLPLVLLLLRWSRRWETARAQRHHFPAIEVATRLGAPFGGGTIAEAGRGQ